MFYCICAADDGARAAVLQFSVLDFNNLKRWRRLFEFEFEERLGISAPRL